MPIRYDFLSRLLKTGATESCSESATQMQFDIQVTSETAKDILQCIISIINWIWFRSDNVLSSLRPAFSEDGMQLQKSIDNLRMEVRSLTMAVNDLHLKHRLLASNFQIHRDRNVQFKAEQRHLAGELASTKSELEESNSKLASLKAQSDVSNVAPIFFSKLGNKQSDVDMFRNEQKEIQDMESSLKELKDLVESMIVEIGYLHERRIEMSKKLVNLKNVLVNFKSISSSSTFLMLKDQVDKSKMELAKYQILLKELQVEEDKFFWHEKEANAKVIRADIDGKVCGLLTPQIDELKQELLRMSLDRLSKALKLKQKSREPSREVVIEDFKNFVSSRHKEMGVLQNELVKLKGSSEIHSLRAQVQSLSALLQREADKWQSLFDKSAGQLLEIKNLHLVVGDLKESAHELMLFLDMHWRESTDSWDAMESRDKENKVWAQVQNLKSSLDKHNLKFHVKTALDPEALTQLRLVTVRRNLEFCTRQKVKLSEKLNSKHENCESYLSEIESIRGSYEDMQIENQQLLQDIIDRDEDNIKLAKEGLKERHQNDVLSMEIKNMSRRVKVAESGMNVYYLKVLRFDEELKIFSNQVDKLADDGRQSSVALDNLQRTLSDACTESQELRHSLNEMQIHEEKSGLELEVAELLIELGRERLNKKRIHEGLEAMRIKAKLRKTQTDEGSVVLEKLQKEISEYRIILKCCVCFERQKEVVITKCYHLFCRQCIERNIESRSRSRGRCPTCSQSFVPNDVKPIYL